MLPHYYINVRAGLTLVIIYSSLLWLLQVKYCDSLKTANYYETL